MHPFKLVIQIPNGFGIGLGYWPPVNLSQVISE